MTSLLFLLLFFTTEIAAIKPKELDQTLPKFYGMQGSNRIKTFDWLYTQRGGQVTIPCFYDKKYRDHVKYLCKGNQMENCTTMVSTDSPLSKNNVSIIDDPTRLVFTVTLKDLQKNDFGYYWCAIKTATNATNSGAHLVLKVNTGDVWTESGWFSAERGGSLTIPCHYDQKYKDHVKYFCRLSSLKSCITLIRTNSTEGKGDVSITDDPAHLVFRVTMKNLQMGDAGYYSCRFRINEDESDVYLPLVVREGSVRVTQQTTANPAITSSVRVTQQTTANPAITTTNQQSGVLRHFTLFVLLGISLLLLLLTVVMVSLWKIHRNIPAKDRGKVESRASLATTDPEADVNYSTVVFKKPRAHPKPITDPGAEVIYSGVGFNQSAGQLKKPTEPEADVNYSTVVFKKPTAQAKKVCDSLPVQQGEDDEKGAPFQQSGVLN